MGCRTSQEPGSRKVGPFQELEVSSGLATLLQGLGEITVAVFDLLYPASGSLSIYPSRSGWGRRKVMALSNPSLEETGDSHSRPSVWATKGRCQPSATLDPDLW